jgi:hypothetical protein
MDIQQYWTFPPPEPSASLVKWVDKIQKGWRPNSRIKGLGYYSSSEFYKVYIWEYINVIYPLLVKLYYEDK